MAVAHSVPHTVTSALESSLNVAMCLIYHRFSCADFNFIMAYHANNGLDDLRCCSSLSGRCWIMLELCVTQACPQTEWPCCCIVYNIQLFTWSRGDMQTFFHSTFRLYPIISISVWGLWFGIRVLGIMVWEVWGSGEMWVVKCSGFSYGTILWWKQTQCIFLLLQILSWWRDYHLGWIAYTGKSPRDLN